MKKRYDKELTLKELAAMRDEDIDYSDIPPLDAEFWENAVRVMPDKTQSVTLRVKKSVLDAYKATGKGYQTRMNMALESFARAVLKQPDGGAPPS
ncbi:MAG: BrnA antitoxin family protein [Alphaproteobacteria bacterium]|nr:BrnA antitoxin family protein [Alphaproteobacteria bacterium]